MDKYKLSERECIQEDEIDLKELFETILKYKYFITLFTLFITILAGVYVYVKTPIYEIKSNVQAGHIGKDLLDDTDVVIKKLRIIFNVDEKLDTEEKFVSKVTDITSNKKVKNFRVKTT